MKKLFYAVVAVAVLIGAVAAVVFNVPAAQDAVFRRAATAVLGQFATHVVVDDERRFVTGQNQNSGHETAHTMMALLAERTK